MKDGGTKEELQRIRRVSDMLCTAHAGLRDRYSRLALFLDRVRDRPSRLVALLTVSVLLCLFYLFLNFQYQGHVMEYLGHGSPWRQILYQQFFSVPQLIPAVLSDEIYWSLPKGVMGFVSVRAAVHRFPPVALILWMCWYCLRRVLVQKSDPGRCSARC